MNNNRIILAVFILVALVQLFVPARMIYEREDVLATGKEFKFKTVPVDPNDPFRGKYITLQYEETEIQLQNETNWVRNETIYVLLSTDDNGFAEILTYSKEKPTGNSDFVKAKVIDVNFNDRKSLLIEYPFNRFYMEESGAPVAEQAYNESLPDTTIVTCALVSVKDGEAVLKDVLIDGVSVQEIVKKRNSNNR